YDRRAGPHHRGICKRPKSAHPWRCRASFLPFRWSEEHGRVGCPFRWPRSGKVGKMQSFVFTAYCADRPGIVSALSTTIFHLGCDIQDLQQFGDTVTGQFFIRIVFRGPNLQGEAVRGAVAPVTERFGMKWALRDQAERRRVLLLVSRFDHCLVDLLYRWRSG